MAKVQPKKAHPKAPVERGRKVSKSSTPAAAAPRKRTQIKKAAPLPTPIVTTDVAPGDSPFRVLVLGSNEEVLAYLAINKEQLAKQYKKVSRVLAKWKTALKSGKYGKVTGYGVEFYKKRGLVVMPPEYCICVSVAVKTPPPHIRNLLENFDPYSTPKKRGKKIHELPKSWEGIRVKVVEANCSFALIGTSASGNIAPPTAVSNPLTGGSAISMDAVNKWGTLGIIFPTQKGLFGLSCKHVVDAGEVLQPPFKAISATVPKRKVGGVQKSKTDAAAGVDAALILPKNVLSAEGVEGDQIVNLASLLPNFRMVVEADRNNWSQLGHRNVICRGARTARVVSGEIIDTDCSITIDGVDFQHLIRVHATPASAAIVDKGDSGSALLMLDGASFIWIGVVVGMIDPNELVACRLPKCLELCGLKLSDFDPARTWPDLK